MRPAVEQRSPLVGRAIERLVAQRTQPCEEDEQRAARNRADGVELKAADPLRGRSDGIGTPPAGRRRTGEPLRVQGQPSRVRERDGAPRRAQIPSPGRNSFVNARCAVCVLGIRSLSVIHCA